MDKQKIVKEAPRWIRVGVLSFITLGPLVGAIATRVRGSSLMPKFMRKEETYGQKMRKRGERITEALADRGSKISHDIVKRSNKVTHTLVERGGKVAEKMTERKGLFVTIAGFGVGLIAAGVAAYLFIQKRMQRGGFKDEEVIELTPEPVGTSKGD